MEKRPKIHLIIIVSFIFLSCCNLSPDDTDSKTIIQKLPHDIQSSILWHCDYEDDSFRKWEDAGTETQYAGGGIFITDEENSTYGIDSNLFYSGKRSAFTTIKNAISPTQKKAVRFMRWTDKAWNEEGGYFPTAAYYSTFFLMKYPYDPAKDPDNDPNNDGGWWNIFQFKSKNNDGSQPVVILDVYNQNGKMYIALIVKDYPDDNSTDHTQEYIVQTDPIPIVNSRAKLTCIPAVFSHEFAA